MRYHVLACDYDGSLAEAGAVAPTTHAALERLQASGRKLIIVTGRRLDDLQRVYPQSRSFDAIVAENGALVHLPASRQTRLVGQPPPPSFLAALRERGVDPLDAGEVIVATRQPQEATVLDVIRVAGLELQVIFNKGAVMVLPSGVNKASGLDCALDELSIDAADVAGVGDAENDHALLQMCGVGAAVANALPSLKEHADLVLTGRHGAGVTQLIERILDGTIDDTPRRPRIQSRRETARVHRLADRHADVHPDA
jgi:hydroxymethylpyrimidine pyrophosphatase-like HAD family hydrolase